MYNQIRLFAVIGLILASNLALADRVDRRQFRERSRIAEGVRSGELTRREARNLRAGQRHVRRMERRAEADGVVTPREARRLEHAQDVQSARIYNQKHDEQTRNQ